MRQSPPITVPIITPPFQVLTMLAFDELSGAFVCLYSNPRQTTRVLSTPGTTGGPFEGTPAPFGQRRDIVARARASLAARWNGLSLGAHGTRTSGVMPATSFEPSARKRTQSGMVTAAPEWESWV